MRSANAIPLLSLDYWSISDHNESDHRHRDHRSTSPLDSGLRRNDEQKPP